MKIPLEFYDKYRIKDDVDTAMVIQCWDEPEGAKVIEVGSHDEPLANMLTDMGYNVTGVDLREYDPQLPPCNYRYLRGDWCEMPVEFWREEMGTYDVFVSVSAIEHFGLCAYSEGGKVHNYYDLVAMRYAWDILKPGGTAYVTVPISSRFLTVAPHWRTYSPLALSERLIQDFNPELVIAMVSGDLMLNGVERKMWEAASMEDVQNHEGIPPHLSVLLKLRKVLQNRKAPDGR